MPHSELYQRCATLLERYGRRYGRPIPWMLFDEPVTVTMMRFRLPDRSQVLMQASWRANPETANSRTQIFQLWPRGDGATKYAGPNVEPEVSDYRLFVRKPLQEMPELVERRPLLSQEEEWWVASLAGARPMNMPANW